MAVAAWVLLPAAACGAEESRAEIEVSGLGWWDNRESRLSLERLLGEAHGPTLNANAVEDAVFLLMSALEEEGYLQPTVEAVLTRADGTESRHTFDSSLATLLPRPMKIAKARFEIEQGVQFAYESIRFSGLTVLAEDEAEALFGADEGLGWFGRAARAYSPGRLRRSLDALQDRLLQRGYAEANVAAEEVTTDEQTGEVEVLVTVSEGPLWRVASLRVAESLASVVENGGFDDRLGAPWTVLWQQDVASEIRQRYYRAGYPDVRVRVE
jgi:outer membrane protein assembly factor BamA